MDIEKLKSLIRLANNNPNDNEANQAARKACRVLAEDDFKILKAPTAANPIFSQDPFMDIINHMRRESAKREAYTWNDVKRSTEPAWKPSQSQRDYYERTTPYGTVFENECQDCHRKEVVSRAEYRSYWTCESCLNKRYPPSDSTGFKIPFDYRDKPPGFYNRPEKKLRKCVACDIEVETRRVTNVFTCDKCEWEAYMRKEKHG